VRYLPGIYRAAGLLPLLLLASCGGGDSKSDTSLHTGVSANSLAFAAAVTDIATPATQSIDVTFSSDIVHLSIVHNGAAIANVTSTVNGRTARVTVAPVSPSRLGAGRYSGSLAITGNACADSTCSRLVAGNTQSVDVTYQVSPTVEFVAPYVGTTNIAATAVIRGFGFGQFAVQSVLFGTAAATEFTVVSDTEIRATYPALAAGRYSVTLGIPTHQGTVPTRGTLVVVDPIPFVARTLAYPLAPSLVRTLIFDAERSALLVLTDAGGGTILRYPYSGGAWGAPSSVAVENVQDMALSTNGQQLLVLSPTSLIPVNPLTLELGTAVPAPSLDPSVFFKNIVVENAGIALITSGIGASALTPLYLYDVRSGTLSRTGSGANNATPAMAADGSRAFFVQGDPSLTTDSSVLAYTASTGVFEATAIGINQNAIAPVLDRSATRLVLNGFRVYDGTLNLLGTLPAATQAVTLRPNGTRAYTYDSTGGTVLTFDVTADVDDAEIAPLLPGQTLAGAPGDSVRATVTTEGNTLFFAGATQIVVQPTPVEP
jgi:hypothetical protein